MNLPVERLPAILCYTVLGSVPLVALAIWPFWEKRRLPGGITAVLLALPVLAQAYLRALAVAYADICGQEADAWCTILTTAVYAAVYFMLVRAPVGKLLFTLLLLANVANLLVLDGKCLEGLLFGETLARQSYGWTASAALAMISLVILTPLALYFRNHYVPTVRQPVGRKYWRYLWLVPATFYLLWFCFCYGSVRSALDIALEPASAGLTLLIDLGGFLIYHTVTLLVDETARNEQLMARNYQLTIQSVQAESMRRQIAATRQARHDLRHHIAVVDSYVTAGEYDKLHEYLCQYKASLPIAGGADICANSAVSALLVYFRQQAEVCGAALRVSVDVPVRPGIPDQTLVALLSNLLENAVDACGLVGGNAAYITVVVKNLDDAMFFRVENPCVVTPVRDRDGTFFSTKHEGKGVGLASVQAIAEQYEGMMTVEADNGRFCVSVLLNKPE